MNSKIELERVLGSPGRVRLLIEMARNPVSMSIYRLRAATGLRREDIKKHLKILMESGLVRELHVDNKKMYMLDLENPVVMALIELFRASGCI